MTWQALFENPRAPKGEPTDLNLWVLDRVITEGDGVIGLLPPTSIPHIRRCLKAGLLEPAGGGQWKLSPKGVNALSHWREERDRHAARWKKNPPELTEAQSRRRVAELRRQGYKVKQVKLADGTTVVLKSRKDNPDFVPMYEAQKGDHVRFSIRGAPVTGSVVRVKKDGTRTVKLDREYEDDFDERWIDFAWRP